MNSLNPRSHTSTKVLLTIASCVICLFFLPSCHTSTGSGFSVSGSQEFADSTQCSFRISKDAQGRKVLQKTTCNYDIIDFIDRDDLKKMLIKVTKSETSFVDSDASQSRFAINVVNINDTKSGWKKEVSGTDVDYSNKVVVVHTEGKGADMEDTYTQYSLLSGEKLMTYTYGQLMALIPGTSHKRFFGYLSQQSATSDKPKDWATISYVSSDKVIDVISIKMKGATKIPPYTPELKMLVAENTPNKVGNEGKTAILTRINRVFTPGDIGNFAMQINYYLPDTKEPVMLLLPVRDDHVDVANANYDKSLFEVTKIN